MEHESQTKDSEFIRHLDHPESPPSSIFLDGAWQTHQQLQVNATTIEILAEKQV